MMDRLMRIDELAAYLGVSVAAIRDWCWMKKIPLVRVGRLVRFRREEIDAWLAQQSVAPEGPRPDLASILACEGRHKPRGPRGGPSRPPSE